MSGGSAFKEVGQWNGVFVRWAVTPILLVSVLILDTLFLTFPKDISVSEDELLLSSRAVPKQLQDYFGQGYRRPLNLDFRQTDSLGYPKYWHFPAIQMLDGFHVQSKSASVEDGPSLRISRDESVDAPSLFRGIALSQVWDVEDRGDTEMVVSFMASFQPDEDAPDATAYVSIFAYPKSGRDPSVFRKQIAKSPDFESYRIEVSPTEKSDWMICSIMTVGDGSLCVQPLSIAGSVDSIHSVTADLKTKTGDHSSNSNSQMSIVFGMMGLSIATLVFSYRDAKPILMRIYESIRTVLCEWMAGSCF